MNAETLSWLLDVRNPGVRVRTLIKLCGLSPDSSIVRETKQAVLTWLPAAQDREALLVSGIKLIYNLVALAECGLSRQDLDISPAVDKLLSSDFDAGCADMLALRALVMLGYQADPRVSARLEAMDECQLTDGGWFCATRMNKMKRVPKSCYKDAMHALLLAAELHRAGILPRWVHGLVQYFLKRRVFYKTAEPDQLVTESHIGWRVIDVFFPLDVMRSGIQNLLEALAVLGAGTAPELMEAWQILDGKKDTQDKVILEGTLSKSYLPKEVVGNPSKWATLYAWLAWKEMGLITIPQLL
jgi:hypothetical protein